MALKESGEMYLEMIYILQKSKANVRSIDVAEQMDFSRASVSRTTGVPLSKNACLEQKSNPLERTGMKSCIILSTTEWKLLRIIDVC